MSDVLATACKSLNIPAVGVTLYSKLKQINLSDPFRLTGLTSNANLELRVQKPGFSLLFLALF
jgi:hypothetical protein